MKEKIDNRNNIFDDEYSINTDVDVNWRSLTTIIVELKIMWW